ncbi:MAG: hypothetical protein JW751_14280 [Polyangiaceae bacterium]|nr:hypothetical protein [Polyangiaceae bacterium]
MARSYSTFADFEREEIRPGLRIGWSVDDLDEPTAQELDFDADPFEQTLWEADQEEDEEQEEDEGE